MTVRIVVRVQPGHQAVNITYGLKLTTAGALYFINRRQPVPLALFFALANEVNEVLDFRDPVFRRRSVTSTHAPAAPAP